MTKKLSPDSWQDSMNIVENSAEHKWKTEHCEQMYDCDPNKDGRKFNFEK